MGRVLIALGIIATGALIFMLLWISLTTAQAALTSAQANLVQAQTSLVTQCLAGFMIFVALVGGVAMGAGGLALRLAWNKRQKSLPVSSVVVKSIPQPQAPQLDVLRLPASISSYPVVSNSIVDDEEEDRLFAGWGW